MTATTPIATKINSQLKKSEAFYSVEFFPPKNKDSWPVFFENVSQLKKINPLFASVTYGAGGTTSKNTLAITAQLASMGIPPMAHLTCVGANAKLLREYLSELEAADVTTILALRGDPPLGDPNYDWSQGEFEHASDLVDFVREEFPNFSIGVAAYPTPHPESLTFEADRDAAAYKLTKSDFAITQVFFDPREYIEYVRTLERRDIKKPIIPGVLPILSLENIRRILSLSGCNIPAKFYLDLEEANKKGGAEAVQELGLEFTVNLIQKLIEAGAPGIHLYTLNNAEICLHIVDSVGSIK